LRQLPSGTELGPGGIACPDLPGGPPGVRGAGAGEAGGLGQDAAADGVEAVIGGVRTGEPFAHLADEGSVPDAGMGTQRTGGEERVERVEDALLLGAGANTGRRKSRRMLRPWSGDSASAAPIRLELERPVL
jgi:hypothetical protein